MDAEVVETRPNDCVGGQSGVHDAPALPPWKAGTGRCRQGDAVAQLAQIKPLSFKSSSDAAGIDGDVRQASKDGFQPLALDVMSSSLCDGPLGRLSPTSHLRTVDALVLSTDASTA